MRHDINGVIFDLPFPDANDAEHFRHVLSESFEEMFVKIICLFIFCLFIIYF